MKETVMSEWKPVGSAPNDGQKVWVLGGRYNEPTIIDADGDWWRWALKDGSRVVPKMWAPLVAPALPGANRAHRCNHCGCKLQDDKHDLCGPCELSEMDQMLEDRDRE